MSHVDVDFREARSTSEWESRSGNVARTGKDGPISPAEFVVSGQRFMGYNGGPYFGFSEGVSLYVDCADQDEVGQIPNRERLGLCSLLHPKVAQHNRPSDGRPCTTKGVVRDADREPFTRQRVACRNLQRLSYKRANRCSWCATRVP
jgi:hypothetical protein